MVQCVENQGEYITYIIVYLTTMIKIFLCTKFRLLKKNLQVFMPHPLYDLQSVSGPRIILTDIYKLSFNYLCANKLQNVRCLVLLGCGSKGKLRVLSETYFSGTSSLTKLKISFPADLRFTIFIYQEKPLTS